MTRGAGEELLPFGSRRALSIQLFYILEKA
jgi:hypothetical protein